MQRHGGVHHRSSSIGHKPTATGGGQSPHFSPFDRPCFFPSPSTLRSDSIFSFVTLCLLLCAPSFTSQTQSLLSHKPRSLEFPTHYQHLPSFSTQIRCAILSPSFQFSSTLSYHHVLQQVYPCPGLCGLGHPRLWPDSRLSPVRYRVCVSCRYRHDCAVNRSSPSTQHSDRVLESLTFCASSNSANPADLTTLCGSDMKNIESQISDKCGDKTQSALKFYANVCNAAGHKVGKNFLTVIVDAHKSSTINILLAIRLLRAASLVVYNSTFC